MATDRELINFSEEHELNSILAKHAKTQSAANRKILCEIGKECKEALGKTILKHEDLDGFIKKHLGRLEDKK